MAIYGYTKNYKLIKPQFDTDTWHDYMYDNLDTIDAVLSAIFASGDWQGFWKSNTHYNVGGVVIDRDTDTMYNVIVEHTTSEATFAEEFAAHPTYYELWSPNNLAKDWAIKMDGQVSNTDYSAKAYAISSELIDDGSAKEWAVGTGTIGDTGEYSAKKHATDAHNDYISMTTDANVVAVGTNIANVNTVSSNISDVNTTATNISSVNTVAGDISRVGLVADDISSVHTVAIDISNVIDVAANKTNIDTVAGISADVSATAAVATSIPTVAGNDANITTVATNISDVNTAATNIAAIQAAPTAASNAAASATLAQEWATKMDGQVASTDYSSKYYAAQSATSANNSHIWAEGTDAQVQALGGVHSSKVWAEQSTNANIALTNSPYTTNRILEIPQDIKLELSNGTLTLKAGSKVYVPNGFEADGTTPKFDVVTIDTDKTVTDSAQRTLIIGISTNGDIQFALEGETGSPAVSTYKYYYDSNANKCYVSTTGVYLQSTFPLCIATSGSNGFTSIDQIFNGFGYIGSTMFALPGVKVQSPNGKNEDGTYKTIIRTIDSVKTFDAGAWTTRNLNIFLSGSSLTPIFEAQAVERFTYNKKFSSDTSTYSYDEDTGQWWYSSNQSTWTQFSGNILGSCRVESGKITSFEPYTVDSVANSNASNFSQAGRSYLSGLGFPSGRYIDLTLGASGAQYTAPANGYIQVSKYSSGGGQALNISIQKFYTGTGASDSVFIIWSTGASQPMALTVPLAKGDKFFVYYDLGGATNTFKFIYAEGEN